ncbi:MAG: hypothetical protein HGA47_00145 [Zoogloea sp.]|nr:hypothetical protein [Zoogloea sp.]
MQIVLDINDAAVSDALQLALEHDLTLNQFLENLIEKAAALSAPTETIELDDQKLDATLQQMLEGAIGADIDKLFKVPELYVTATGQSWKKLSPNTRKTLGRRFRKLADEHNGGASRGDIVIEFQGRNLQNAAIYKVRLL